MSDDNVIHAGHHFLLKNILEAQSEYQDLVEGEDDYLWLCGSCGSDAMHIYAHRGLVCAQCGKEQDEYFE